MTDIAEIVKDMSEAEVRNTLYEILSKFSRVDGISYTDNKCYADVQRIVGNKVFNKPFGGVKNED